MSKKTLSIVISAYNEEGNIKELYKELKKVTKDLPLTGTEIIFVNDGSKDKTLEYCKELQAKDPEVKIVNFAKNFGHEIAMTAGKDYAKGDAVIFMDADLQHPPKYIKDMVNLWQNGHDIVLTKRKSNAGSSIFYKILAKSFYAVLNFLSDVRIPASSPDFRLLDRKYIEYLKEFKERDALFRGLLSLMATCETLATIEFVAPERFSGETKYSYIKGFKLALDSILQFSVRPLYLSLWLAVAFGVFGGGLGIYVIIERYIVKNPVPGYATIVSAVVFMGALNLFILAIIGAYIAKIHMEAKRRPLYLAEYLEKKKGK